MGYTTKYGELNYVSDLTRYPNGNLKDCTIEDKIEINTDYGVLIPQYEFTNHRKKYISSLSFFENGTIRRIALNEQMIVNTPIGKRKAELITFYECGAMKRLFPLNGHLTAYWEEEDEYQLATEDSYDLSCGNIVTKAISVYFYKNGTVKSLTLWPREIVQIQTPLGGMAVRIGISFYADGSIQSIEPATHTLIHSPIGSLIAYDENVNGILGDQNSLIFTKEGELLALATSNQKVIAKNIHTKEEITFSPHQELDDDQEEVWFHPLKIEFEEGYIRFNEGNRLEINQYEFKIKPYRKSGINPCANCASCNGCNMEQRLEGFNA